ncbi:MAG: AAA family ATPase [Clostridia bacterium]|nr:AAA family ATPase [Clostridia bacterium]
MYKYGLTGMPLGHSMSKIIHEEILKIKNIDGKYSLLENDNLDKSFKEVLTNLDGFNVTIPYKKDIIKYLDVCSDEVKLYNVCNTVKILDNVKAGYNTDVYGFNDTLLKNSVNLKGKKVLVLGNGGVSTLIVLEAVLKDADVYISGRNKDKIYELINFVFLKTGVKPKYIKKEDIDYFDVMINGTSLGMYPNVFDSFIPLEKLKNISVVFDVIYNPYKTLMLRVAEYYGNKGISGLNMLVAQAVKAQEIFNDITLSEDEFLKVLNKAKENIPPFKVDKNIILIGAPASGKTSISREIAKIFNMQFIDIDQLIAEKEGMTINEIFEKKGEKYFREKEREVFLESIKNKGRVISTGGGLAEYFNLNSINKEENIIVYIDVNKDILFNRIKGDTTRPLLKDDKNKLFEIIERRHPVYKECCSLSQKVEKEENIKDTTVKIIDKIISKI